MHFKRLFEIQAGLDLHIENEHPVQEGENRLAKKILALKVELGELANEWRGFKFWSNDQSPRTLVLMNNPDKTDKNKPWIIKNLLLEEYVDCLHFILSIGLELGFKNILPSKIPLETDVVDLFNLLFEHISFLRDKECHVIEFYSMIFKEFITLGEMLGFTRNEVVTAYLAKNKINHERQATGY